MREAHRAASQKFGATPLQLILVLLPTKVRCGYVCVSVPVCVCVCLCVRTYV
jgi:hypothetical protein